MRTTYLSWATGFISGLNYVGSMLFIFLVVCFCFVMYSFCVLCRMLSVDCAFLIASSVFSHVYLPKTMRLCDLSGDTFVKQVTGNRHRYVWTGPYDASPFFLDVAPPLFLTSIFFHINNILQLSMYHCIVFIVDMSYYYVRKPAWIETTVWLYLLYICHTVIHRKLQNVVYMKKNRC